MSTSRSFSTIGHSTHSLDVFIALLEGAGIQHLIDVRSIRRSRTNPQFNQDNLPGALLNAGVAYSAMDDLGGRRARQHEIDPHINAWWQNTSFHNYADYALGPRFHAGLEQLR